MADEATERITILLQAKDAEFQRALEKNNRALARFAKSAERDTKSIGANLKGAAGQAAAFGKSFVAGLAIGAITAAFAAVTSGARAAVADLADLKDSADKIGLSTTSFQALQFGMQQAGVQASEFTAGMEKFSENIGDAARGVGAFKGILESNGIAVRDNAGNIRETTDILNDFANVIASTGDESARLSLITEGFGRGGKAMVLALQGGADGLRDMQAAAIESGAVLNDAVIQRAAEIDDKFEVLSVNVSNFFKSMAVDAAAAGFAMSEAMSSIGDAPTDSEALATALSDIAVSAHDAAIQLGGEATQLRKLFGDDVAGVVAGLSVHMEMLSADFATGTIGAELFFDTMMKDAAAAEELFLELQRINGIDMSSAISVLSALGWRLSILQGQADAAARAVAAAAMTLPPLRGPAGSSGVAPLRSGTAPLTSPRPRGAPNDIDFGFAGGGGGGGGSAAVKDLDAIIQKAEEYAKAMDDYLIDTNESLRESFLDLALDGTNSFDAIAKSIKRAALEAFLFGQGPFGNLLGGGIMSLFGGGNLFGGNSWGGARAAGGPVTAGKTYAVGEKGVELFTPSVSGAIVPNHKVSGAGGTVQVLGGDLVLNDNGTISAHIRVTGQQSAQAAVNTARRSMPSWQAEYSRTGALV